MVRFQTHAVLALLAAAGAAAAQCGSAETILTNDRAANDEAFGALAAGNTPSGWLVVTGARLDDNARGADAGSIYTFLRNNGAWQQLSRFHADDGAPGDLLGVSVAFDDPYCIAGATNARIGGAAYIFQRSGNSWNQVAKVNPSGGSGALVGHSVALEGSHAIVGAPGHNHFIPFGTPITGAGLAAVYYRNPQTGAWNKVGDLDPGTNADRHDGDGFGYAVAMSGDQLIAGAPGWDVPVLNLFNHGEVRAYRRTSATTWSVGQRLYAADRAGGDQFGRAVSVKGNVLAVGAPFRDHAGRSNVGAVYFFRLVNNQWVADGMVLPSDTIQDANFGQSISVAGDEAVVSAPGTRYVYHFKRYGPAQWGQYARYRDPDGPDLFGGAVVTDGTWIVAGDVGDDPGGVTNAGAGYAFRDLPFSADKCDIASPVSFGQYVGCNNMATVEHFPACAGTTHPSPDVWFSYFSPGLGHVDITATSVDLDTVLSVHDACPATANNTVACNDDWSIFTTDSRLRLLTNPGVRYYIRVSGKLAQRGSFTLGVGSFVPAVCPPDCDQSTGAGVLDIFDFLCFQNRFDAGLPYACNFDTGTGAGVCDIFDFLAFQNSYAGGCP